jgi:hypothetical protein
MVRKKQGSGGKAPAKKAPPKKRGLIWEMLQIMIP